MSLEKRGVGSQSAGTLNRVSRDTHQAVLYLSNGAKLEGTLHLPTGTRIIDLLNHEAEAFIAMTNAVLTSADGRRPVEFVAVNKVHVITACELSDAPVL